jgi:transketolase
MDDITDKKIIELELKANDIRKSIIEMLVEAGSGHTAGALGMADIFSALYFHILHHDPKRPDWHERDRVILSNGHICPVLYATLAHAGYFLVEELKTLRKFGSRLQGHPHREWLPILETSSGPLGEGLSQAVGMALADRMDRGRSSSINFFVLMGDGEMDEGSNYEAMMLAGKERLHNVIAIVDRNNIQIDGFTEDIMPLESMYEKWQSFNWHVQEIDGHSFDQIINAIAEAKTIFDKPSVIIANTVPGKGVAEFERRFEWHGKPPNRQEADMALSELNALGDKIRSEKQ